jgi:23S rRNA (uridine2552-2'-O)-methyltransferase
VASRRSRSSERWLREHFADPYVKRARAQGARSRAIFKLEEIDQREHLLRSGMLVLDLGAAPGAWSQYARRRVGPTGRVIASDILPIEPIPGVQFLQGDFREDAVLTALRAALGGAAVDVLLSDMAPNLSGMDAIDAPRGLYLAELALDLADQTLKPDGSALIKVLQGAGFEELVRNARRRYQQVRFVKPAASRSRSPETYLLASVRRMV